MIRLHHIGMVVSDIDDHVKHMREYLNFELSAQPVVDQLQRVKVAFINTNTDVSIELIEPVDEKSPVYQFLRKGGGLNHLCYSVSDINATIDSLSEKGCLVVSEPKPAVVFDGRFIAFLYSPDRQLIVLLESESD